MTFAGIHKDINFSIKKEFIRQGKIVNRDEWQGIMEENHPMMITRELVDVAIDMSVPDSIQDWQEVCNPNLPWAEDHFQERVGGVPLNPGEQYKNWPWYKGGVEDHKPDGRFSHTYMERMWPGGAFGNLGDVIKLLANRPMTRQAFLTIWWPHDAKLSNQGERVPCSIGYLIQWSAETEAYDMWYFMRSVDFVRYLWDDIYMAGRLLQWVLSQLPRREKLGTLHTKIANLHIFEPEFSRIESEYKAELNERMFNAF